jgi:hypothetical protein
MAPARPVLLAATFAAFAWKLAISAIACAHGQKQE